MNALVTENDHIIAAHNKQIAQFFPVALAALLSINKKIWVRPQIQKCLVCQSGQISL